MWFGTTIIFSVLGYTILMLCICMKKLFSTAFFIIKVHLRKEINLDSHSNLHFFCDWVLQPRSPYWDTRYWCFVFARITFLSTIFLIIIVHLWNETNLDTYNNLYSFLYCALQSCSCHWDTQHWCFDLAKKSFLSTIFLIVKVFQ